MQELFLLPASQGQDSDEEMKLRDDDKKWLSDEIILRVEGGVANAVDKFRPHGWRKTTYWLREWGLAGTALAVPLTLLAICVAVGIFAASGIKENTQFRTRTEDRLTTIETSLLSLRTSQAADNPTDKNSQAEATNLLAAAKRNSLRMPTTIIEQAGGNFVKASSKEPSAWNVALQFLNYRSVLNASSLPAVPKMRPYHPSGTYDMVSVIWATHPLDVDKPLIPMAANVWLAGEASPQESARVEFLDKPLAGSSGAKFIVFDWQRSDLAFGLDYVYLKNVIIRNAVIHYSGGPVHLDHVYFVNCTFDLVLQPQGQNLAFAVLESTDINFTQPKPPATHS